jgi:stress response protein YsnF
VVEDEVVVQKNPVAKEEIRIRKDVVHERQIVEEDVRREEVDIEDDTSQRRG